ncbi:MAG: 50S ribosomal protein L3 [Candidatus Gracilibacteria bacterium]|nr:50S ribosomal protein L3 [Candidatus Gracilibacteria bacterium]MDD2908840.1 50S ribosomal protein L3 [Candidatus Gracilibacteria bacterium]
MAGIIGKKLEMTRIIKGDKLVPVTLIKIPELIVAQVKTIENDGYEAVVLQIVGSDTLREVPLSGVLKDVKKDDIVNLDILDGILEVKVMGISKGKGFAGAMKRHNFHGGPGRVGSKFHRALGSIGNRKPRRTKPGQKMHGHMGLDQVTLKHVPLELVNKNINVIAVKGPVPGARNSLIVLNF